MLFYCLKCRENTESKHLTVSKTKKGKLMLLPYCAVCASTKMRFIKEEEARGLLSSLGMKVPILSKIPIIKALLS